MSAPTQYTQAEKISIALAQSSWEKLTDAELSAACLSATFGIPRQIHPSCIAFKPARDLNLIDRFSGEMHELAFKGLELAASRIGEAQ